MPQKGAPLDAELAAWIAARPVTQGPRRGELLAVLPWERRFLRGVFRREISTAALSIARGNGKTTWAAAIAAACVAPGAPLVQPRGEVVVVASSFAQARIAFEHVRATLRPEIERAPRAWRVNDSANTARIEDRRTEASVRCIGSDPDRAHGLAPRLVLADEPAAWPRNSADRMRAALETALGKLEGARMLALGTRPADPDHWFARALREADYRQEHAAGPDDPPFRRATWRKANPSLAHMPQLERQIRREARAARRDPQLLAAFRALRLNLGTADVDRASLVDAESWRRAEGEALAAGAYVLGFDLGTSAAMSAAAAYWPESGRLDVLAAFPRDPDLRERGLTDGVGRLYQDMHRRGELVLAGGRAVKLEGLLEAVLERWGPPAAIACDRWRADELRDALDVAGVPRVPLAERGQGFKDGGEDVRAFRRAVADDRVVPVPSLLMRAALGEAVTVSDPAGNAKLAKGSEGGRRQLARDDAAAAAILAVAEGSRRYRPRRPGAARGRVILVGGAH